MVNRKQYRCYLWYWSSIWGGLVMHEEWRSTIQMRPITREHIQRWFISHRSNPRLLFAIRLRPVAISTQQVLWFGPLTMFNWDIADRNFCSRPHRMATSAPWDRSVLIPYATVARSLCTPGMCRIAVAGPISQPFYMVFKWCTNNVDVHLDFRSGIKVSRQQIAW